jgi:hypothetical protein
MTEIGSGSHEKFAVLSIFAFSIVYRILLLQVDIYPPGPDVGLHESIINSIILKNGNFTWNYYHMGGGVSLTHPGFHIFTSFIILMTGMPDYMAQSLVVVMFSSLIVLCTFLLAKEVWGLPLASLIAAFMAAISKYDLEMMLWGGYPNVITLMIIPLIFYMFLRKETSSKTFLVTSSLLIGTIFLTHSLSTLVFLCIAAPFIVLELLISRKSPKNTRPVYFFAVSIILGFIIASPFLIEAFPIYLENVNKGMFIGGVDENKLATILTRSVPMYLVLVSLIPALSLFLFSKKYKSEFFSKSSVLLSLWILVPAFSTQSFIIGLYTDYYRLLHFLILPVVIFLAIFVAHGINFLVRATWKAIQARKEKINFNVICCFSVTAILLISSSVSPFFASPNEGFTIANYYDVVTPLEFESIKWIKQNTPTNSVFVSEHGYGWWISGFGQRVTLSATDPQFLIIPHEFEAASIARTLLDTDFVLNNGLIEIREDGGYVGRHNPMLLVDRKRFPDPYPILYFNESEMTLFYRNGIHTEIADATAIPVKDIKVETIQGSARLSIIKENEQLVLTRKIEVFKGVKFVVISINVECVGDETSLEYLRLMLHARGKILQSEKTVGVLDEGAKICGQVIFEGKTPVTKLFTTENPTCMELFYNVENTRKMEIKMVVGGFEVEKVQGRYIQSLLSTMTNLWFMKEENATSINIFDYREVIRQKGISFFAFKRKEYPVEKFLNDPLFNLVFINDNIAIFEVRKL